MFSGLFRSSEAAVVRERGPKQPPPGTVPRGLKENGKRKFREAKKRANAKDEEEDEEPEAPVLSKKQRRKLRKLGVEQPAAGEEGGEEPAAAAPAAASPAGAKESLLLSANAGSRTIQGRAAQRLAGSRFRWLNDLLYNSTGAEAKKVFDEDRSLMVAYHEGYEAQRQKWPKDPLDDIITWLREKVPPSSVIGDFGCGEARLALELSDRKVHSFDINPVNERVTPCNLAAVPLEKDSLDIASFCLALMGTDWPAFVKEAHRCLRKGGLLHISEVESRFANIQDLVTSVEAIGFRKVFENPESFFVQLRFKKINKLFSKAKLEGPGQIKKKKLQKKVDQGDLSAAATALQACNYRRR